MKGSQGYEMEGVRGLKALGVRDLSYKLAYLACTVTPTSARVSVAPDEKGVTVHIAFSYFLRVFLHDLAPFKL